MQATILAVISVVVWDFGEITPALGADVVIAPDFNYGDLQDDFFSRFVPALFHIF